ncbi:hypothetical protein DSM112329_04901 [Paraconexibacter sp. AEG42_29]|uniref:Uncharacterized protein n=1 Tax=Paraconexibacter sp. AEG42_29 TaxID=2997339 RepID=A0AAU7B1W2_9ACTN
MSHGFQGRTALRSAAVSVVALASLATAGSAQAALGGGKVPALTDRPNLVSVTPSATAITFTYDRTIGCPGGCDATEFNVGGYDVDDTVQGQSATVSGNSVRVVFAGGNPDTDQLTFGLVEDNAVNTQGSLGATNLSDSVRVTGAEGESGTRGHTTGPDLVSAVATGGGSNFITLTFDQDISDDPNDFDGTQVLITKADGTQVGGIDATVSIDDNTADVEFLNTDPVTGAKLVTVSTGTAESDDFGTPSPTLSVQVGTQNQDSQAPILKSAELAGADTVLYTFDKAIGAATPGQFFAVVSDTTRVAGLSATVVGDGKQVQVQFDFDQYTEYLVSAHVNAGAATAQADNTPSVLAGVPIGGNAGAKATGFTDAPDAVQATYSGANVVVTLDSRIDVNPVFITPANFQLLADDGTIIGGTPTATPQAQGVPGPSRINLLYNTTAVANARGIRLLNGAVESLFPGKDNIDQQLGR